MLRRSPRAVLLWTAAVIVALVTAGYVANILVSLRHQDVDFGRVHTVVVASRDLPLGRRVRAGDLADRRVRGEIPEPGALTVRAGDVADRQVRGAIAEPESLTVRSAAVGRPAFIPATLQ